MKKIIFIIGAILVVCGAIQNRAILLIPFVHDGMTQAQIIKLLGHEGDGNGFVVKGLVGTGPAHETWTYHIRMLGYSYGSFTVRFEGDSILKTKQKA